MKATYFGGPLDGETIELEGRDRVILKINPPNSRHPSLQSGPVREEQTWILSKMQWGEKVVNVLVREQ